MSLTPVQRRVAEVLRPFRTGDSYVAGGLVLNRLPGVRVSDDMDIFNDERSLPDGASDEIAALRNAGFRIEPVVDDDYCVEIIARWGGADTKIQWAYDDEYCKRFFAADRDAEFGYRLHPADAAVNKVLCASRRREARDAVDVLNLVRNYASLGAIVWAAAGKAGISPAVLLRDLHARIREISEPELRTVRMDDGVSPPERSDLLRAIEEAVESATRYFDEVAPIECLGCLIASKELQLPVEADEKAISEGEVQVIPITTFGPKVELT